MQAVQVDHLGDLSIMGLMVKALIDENLKVPERAALASGLDFTTVLRVGRMTVTLSFGPEGIRIENGAIARPTCTIQGEMRSFLKLGVGGNPIIPFLMGRIKVRGDIRKVPALMKLLVKSQA